MAKKSWAERRLAEGRTARKESEKRVEAALDQYRNMSDAEKRKIQRNIADGYKPLKGLRNGYCNRYACQEPIGENPELRRPREAHAFMTDHEGNGLDRLYYCIPCGRMFNDSDEMARRQGSTMPNRISYEEIPVA